MNVSFDSRPQDSTVSITRLLGFGGDMPRVQNPKLQQTKGHNPRWFIRPYVPIRIGDGVKAIQKYIYLGLCSEVQKRQAIVAKNQAMGKINRRQWVISTQIPFGEFIDRWLKTFVLAEGNLSSATVQKYQSHIDSRIRPAFGHLSMGEIDTHAVDEWLKSLAEAGLSYNTRKDLRNTLSGIFTKARKWGLWKEANPALDATVGRMRYLREKRFLTAAQLRALLDRLPPALALICKLALLTLRISEVLALQEKHLDFDARCVRVRQRYYVGDIDVPKSSKSSRDIPMGILFDELRVACVGEPERFLFADWTYNRAAAILREAARAMDIYWEGFGFHQFRRQAKTGIGGEGLDPFQVMRLSGHGHADESLLYTLNDNERQEQAVRRFQERIWEPKDKTVN